MRKHLIHTIISAMVFWGVCGPAAALSAEDDQVFLDMINKIREAPYVYARDLGYTHEALIKIGILPEIKKRLAPYTLDSDLTAAAAEESKEMASEDMASEEITVSDTRPVYRLTASTGGVVSFFNFMSRETAFKIVINYLFKKELDNESFDHILSKDYSSAGIAISAGKVGSGNAWFVAICLRSSELVSQIQMLNLINQVRHNPDNIWNYTSLNRAEAYILNPNIVYLGDRDNGYKPLFFDASLSASARARSAYELNGTYPQALSEAQTDFERAAYYLYDGEFAQEYAARMKKINASTEENDPSVNEFFQWLIQKELESWPQSPVAFSVDFQDIGSNMAFQSSGISGEIYDLWVLSFVVGKNGRNTIGDDNSTINTAQNPRIYGVLFADIDKDNLYDPGEEIGKQTVTAWVHTDGVEGMQEVKQVATTDNAGHFSMELEANRQYLFVATIGEVSVRQDLFITSDQFVKLGYTPAVP
ncbi:CAP domain-containing protein [Desulfobacter sp. UBA2225]|uniref:CAP domain-containing protein n=1 Tax=Desulfobacter sp. UBA2225 TaxID=1961413 RepID=UPI00257B4F00|nr:CAP domain-containing protein [Desulfobacter sp. UBA2225]